jgi:hypothetical protein
MSMQFKFGVLLGLSAWVTVLRLVFTFINDKLKEFMEQALPAEKEGVQRFLNSLLWRLVAFLLNTLASIKLPMAAKKGSGNTETIKKEDVKP